MKSTHFDVLIIGAGLSGIGMAYRLSRECPGQSYAILERRARIGGTWDLFTYPGIRSDSDMYSFGFDFNPWPSLQILADGPSIRNYIDSTAEQYDIKKRIHFGIELTSANWCSKKRLWTLIGSHCESGTQHEYSCNFLIACTGYYDHKEGYLPQFPGAETFQGNFIHPQHWPENFDYRNKRVIVIGSGATAVTLVPELAGTAKHVTMLQRSPSYIISVPSLDKLSSVLLKFLPKSWVHRFGRWRNIKLQRWIFKAAKRWPDFIRKLLLKDVRKSLPDGFDLRHFTPNYKPWEQRLCVVPDGDLFTAISSGNASINTGEIHSITAEGIKLKSGQQLDTDVIISATGLKLQVLGGIALSIDGKPVSFNERITYKAVLVEGIPNMSWVFGYTNAPWTLKADITARYICKLLNHMRAHNQQVCTAVDSEGCAEQESVMSSLVSGYVKRANKELPRQGRTYPWRLSNNYEEDCKTLLNSEIEDEFLTFTVAETSTEIKYFTPKDRHIEEPLQDKV
ncbi:NAD(P)/FAD-dependent oxidoreductase [Microbulbifer sp. OS29]|uniref:NAD(P)/FAD-dependent oxidoreductase n=1 Tax=Microbulbifer okhotskensis TaxID=2926617 RepID=A0A9X2EM19_9GAMM|nr:NAD(P)/FAD-dependent oxidoreductase [Microbulbifer okhotskensis]MCO1334742.1 NAD(P)/FAD-dependent oxidoreductase [Microbulbifer okhotskensis]